MRTDRTIKKFDRDLCDDQIFEPEPEPEKKIVRFDRTASREKNTNIDVKQQLQHLVNEHEQGYLNEKALVRAIKDIIFKMD